MLYGVKKLKDLNKVAGTHRLGCIRATYSQLAKLLGKPMEGDGYKVSGEWALDFQGDVITVYDWKSTRLYDNDESLPTVKDFRASKNPVTFNIGGHNAQTIASFIERLSHELDAMQTKDIPKLKLIK